jgi:glycerophosphoryl diester phosphodiesterase
MGRFVEIDIRPTGDGDFAVFHDDVLDCKTDAVGAVAARTMEELRTLDVGHGYVTEAGE